ncbi:MFS transporter [Microbacterium ulmi]|uniref:MFS transporter n=1 Tax=Microbacterium ulmi TaxID=179095 RepID=A0A7Y2M107_9MICO|nr:MFS transporter [Microbacterium ulmi]NII70238.1 MFS family permease [Microbacterium ulmi]NNH04501.1 MFS transporter [Microbacterium ulmi]
MSETLTAPIRVKVGAVVGFLVFVELTSGFLQGYYLPLIAAIAHQLSVTDADITWFATLQTLAAGVSVPILAKLGDIFGHRRMLRIAIVVVLVGTLLVALAPSFPLVLVGRVLTGPLAVWLPLEIALVHNRIKGETARKAIGMLVSALTIGVLIGGLTAGVLGTAIPSLLVVLLVPAIIVAICLVIVFTLVPESTIRSNPRIDGVGFTLLAVFMLALLFGLRIAQTSGFGNGGTISLLVGAAALLVAFVVWELRHSAPAINIRLIASRALWPVYVTSFLFGMVLFGTQTLITTFLAADPAKVGYGFAFAPGILSLFTAGTALLAAIGASTFAYLAKPLGLRGVLFLGVALNVAGNLALAVFSSALPIVVIAFIVSGLGAGLLLGALPALIAEVAPADETGIAAGVYNSLRTLGGAVAGATFGVVLAAFVLPDTAAAGIGGYVTVWLICAVCFALAFVALLFQRTQHVSAAEPVAVGANA